jgi:DNA replication licensing factor MCM3
MYFCGGAYPTRFLLDMGLRGYRLFSFEIRYRCTNQRDKHVLVYLTRSVTSVTPIYCHVLIRVASQSAYYYSHTHAMSLLDEPVPQDDLMLERTRIFEEFLTAESPIYSYKDDILRMLRLEQSRLIVNIDDLRDYRRDFADGLLKQPVDFLPAFHDALLNVIQRVHDIDKHDVEGKGYGIGFNGSFGDHHVSPRTLRASHLGHMISLEGIVTRCSLVRPKMLKSVHYCPDTSLFHAREYRDATSSTSNLPPTSSITPQTDDQGHPLQIEYGFSTFRDHQRISIQEMPERAPAGQLPRSTDVILDDDLVDKCKPGDRIQLVGMYRSVGGGATGTFKCVLLYRIPRFTN